MTDHGAFHQGTLIRAHCAYFDTAAAAPPPKSVIDKVQAYLTETAVDGPYLPSLRKRVYEDIEHTRAKMAYFIGANSQEIAFTKNGTESICMVAQGIDWQTGDEVIIPDTEMLSNLSIWLQLEKQRGIKVVRARANAEGMLAPEMIAQEITAKTRLISCVALSNVTGAVQPITEICSLAKTHGILSHINASQALGILNIDVHQWGCDFLSACGRKGLRAIEGSGILYVSQPYIGTLTPCLVGWWNSTVDEAGALILPETAKRFEAGCPNTPAIYGLDAALDHANTLGQAQITQCTRALTEYAVQQLSTIAGFALYGPKSIHDRMSLIPFNIRGLDPRHLVSELEKRHIIIEAGHFMATSILKAYDIDCMARICVNYFNSKEEIHRLVSAIIAIQEESA